MDVIFYPEDKGNMARIIEMAETLGTKSMIIIGCPVKEFPVLRNSTKIKIIRAEMISGSNISKAGGDALFFGTAERACIEHPRIAAIIDAEILEKKDKLHQRSSGLNAILAKIAMEKEKVLLIDVSLLDVEKRAKTLGRFFQNVLLAKKVALPLLVVSGASHPFQLRAPQELKSLSEYLGIPPSIVRKAERLLGREVSSR